MGQLRSRWGSLLFGFAWAAGCAGGAGDPLDGTCHKGTLGCQCLEGTCEIGTCSPVSGRCVFEADDGTGTGTDETGDCAAAGEVGCPCGDDEPCLPQLACEAGACIDPGQACGDADLQNDPENCGACGNVCAANPGQSAGTCKFGACAPVMGSCFAASDAVGSCAEYCASIDSVCSDGACSGRVAMQFDDDATCEAFEGTLLQLGCTDPFPEDVPDARYRCCCGDFE